MNEHEWKRGRDPEAMLAAVQDRLSQRKWVLLNCAVARGMDHEIFGTSGHPVIDDYELNPERAPGNLFEVAMKDFDAKPRDPNWAPPEFPIPPERDWRGDVFRRAERRFEIRREQCEEEARATRVEFLSYFPMYWNAETWAHVRPALSTVVYNLAKAEVYRAAERHVPEFIRKKARTPDTPAAREEVESQLRTIQKQLVLDMNKAMRNYAKPANELLAHFLHEQLGNPYQPYEFDPAWRTSDVMGLARSIEADRGFDRMNMLADALMEAGCEHEGMLLHMQEEREHQRGCWVLDLILGHDTELFARPPIEDVSGTGGRHEPLGLAVPRNWDV